MGCCSSSENAEAEAKAKAGGNAPAKKSEPAPAKAEPAKKAAEPKKASGGAVERKWELSADEQQYKAHLIGPKGATIKGIKEKTGAHVELEGVCIVFDGTDDQVAKARDMCSEILKAQQGVDYCGPEGRKLRDQAQLHYDKQHKLHDDAQKAFDSNDKDTGHKLMAQSKEEHAKAEECDKQAAAVIIKHRNDGKGDLYLDLHGLKLEEAIHATEEKVNALKASNTHGSLELIPGAGHHSAGHAVLKPKVEEWLRKHNLKFEEKNAGSLLVTV